MPIGYEVFPGAFYEGHTLITVLNRLSKYFELDKIVFVADRELFNKENLDFLEEKKIFHIVGGRVKNLNKKQKLDILTFKESIKDKTIGHFTLNINDKCKLIVSYNWVERRIKAHLAISYMAFCCVRYLEYIISKEYLKISCEKIKDHLLEVQSVIIKDQKSKLRYLSLSKFSEENTKIYSILGKSYTSNVQPLV